MNIIGENLNLDTVSSNYFDVIKAIRVVNDNSHRHTIAYNNGTRVEYQKAHSLIAKFDIALAEAKSANMNVEFIKFLEFLFDQENNHQRLSDFIRAKPNELRKWIGIFEKLQFVFRNVVKKDKNGQDTTEQVLTEEGKIIESIFDYEKICPNVWLGNALNLKACTYCNAQYTVTIEETAKFELDHFYPKSKYPYLALCFYNLIPSCGSCNRKKLQKSPYDEIKLIHPYEESFHQKAKFQTDEKGVVSFILNGKFESENFNITLSNKTDDFVKTHDKIFDLEKVANTHKDLIAELYAKAYIYCGSRKEELVNAFVTTIQDAGKEKQLALFNDEKDIERIVFGNYMQENDFNLRPLSKLTHDIAKELGLL